MTAKFNFNMRMAIAEDYLDNQTRKFNRSSGGSVEARALELLQCEAETGKPTEKSRSRSASTKPLLGAAIA